MVFNSENLKGLTFKHFWTDLEHLTGKIVLYNNSVQVGYVAYEKEKNVENLFSTTEYIKICEQNNVNDIFKEIKCYYISWLEVEAVHAGKGYGNILMLEILQRLDNENYSNLFIVNACPYLRENQKHETHVVIPIKILVKFYERFGFKTFLDLKQNQLMYRKTT